MRASVLQPQWPYGGRIPPDARCHICGKWGYDTPAQCRHHVYGGPLRKVSEANGLWVYLCHMHHNASGFGVHLDREADLALKAECQRAFEGLHGRGAFVKLTGKSWL